MSKKRTIYCNPQYGGCGVTVEAKAETVEQKDRCLGPARGKPCPVDEIWKVIKAEQARQAEYAAQDHKPTFMAG